MQRAAWTVLHWADPKASTMAATTDLTTAETSKRTWAVRWAAHSAASLVGLSAHSTAEKKADATVC